MGRKRKNLTTALTPFSPCVRIVFACNKLEYLILNSIIVCVYIVCLLKDNKKDNKMEYNGSCLCGNVQFKLIGEITNFYLCHCKYCRKDTGSAHASNLFFNKGILVWVKGEDKITKYNYNGTRHNKSFCSTCGSALPIKENDFIIVPAGSLDCHIDKIPDGHIFMESRGNWDNKLEALKKFEKLPN
jgi:hypothetical protein